MVLPFDIDLLDFHLKVELVFLFLLFHRDFYSLFFWLKPPSLDGRDFSPCLVDVQR